MRRRFPIRTRWAASVILAVLAATAALRYRLSRPDRQPGVELSLARDVSGIAQLRPADVPLALLGDFYENVDEHVPPRDPTQPLQRRERFYRPPAEPFDLVLRQLSGSPADVKLKERMEDCERQWVRGDVLPPAQFTELETLAVASSLSAEVLLDAGRAFDFLMGDHAAAGLFRAGLTKAQRQYQRSAPGDPACLPLLYQLDQTKALSRLEDHAALIQRFELAARLYPALSVEARRSQCLYARSLFKQGKSEQAADTILRLWQQDEQAGDLGKIDPSDRVEMDWLSGLYLISARRYEEAIPYFKDFLKRADRREPTAVRYLSICLRRLGRGMDAEELLARYHLSTGTPATRPLGATPPMASPQSPALPNAAGKAG